MNYTDKGSISIIIPVFNEYNRLPKQIKKLKEFQKNNSLIKEVIFVDDGSTDKTFEYLNSNILNNKNFSIIRYEENKGKGYAIKEGFKKFKGDYALFMDADLSVPLEDINTLMKYAETSDIVIGSRRKNIKPIYPESGNIRFVISNIGSKLRKFILLPHIKDTQCGFKLLNKKSIDIILSLSKIPGYAFDMEFLTIAKVNNLNIKEVGVPWKHADGGHLSNLFNMLTASLSVFFSILYIYFKSRNGSYSKK